MRHGPALAYAGSRWRMHPGTAVWLPPAARNMRRYHTAHTCRLPPSEALRSVGGARALQASESLSTESSSLWLSMLAIGKERFLAELKIVGK